MAKILTVFFSLKGENHGADEQTVYLAKGYTAVAAGFIQKTVGGDIFEIKTVKNYSRDYLGMLYEAQEEQENGIRPELREYVDIDDYDIIYLGYPNWWLSLPMAVVSFLEHYDWSGKRVIVFVTSGGGGFGNSIKEIRKICTGIDILAAGHFLGYQVEDSEQEISEWAKTELTKAEGVSPNGL